MKSKVKLCLKQSLFHHSFCRFYKSKFPEDFKPIEVIYNFILLDGPNLWNALKNNNYEFVEFWLKTNNKNIFICHPLTGNNIAHENLRMISQLRVYPIEILLKMTNYEGIDPISYQKK